VKQYNYKGVDQNGNTVRGTTTGPSKGDVKAQLKEFGFTHIRVKEKVAAERATPAPQGASPPQAEEEPRDDFVQKLIDGDVTIEDDMDEEEAAQDEWRRLEVIQRVREYRHKENITLAIILVVLISVVAYYIFSKMTEVKAPQPKIIAQSSSEMLSFKDVYVDGPDLIFIVYGKNWNGNVRVDFKAWDPFGEPTDRGIARLGFIGDYYGGSPEKSGAIRLKKTRFYETIEVRVSGDEGK